MVLERGLEFNLSGKKGEITMPKITKNVSVMCFHDELCQVYNALMTALSLLREGSMVTLFFGSRGVNAIHKDKVKELKCRLTNRKRWVMR